MKQIIIAYSREPSDEELKKFHRRLRIRIHSAMELPACTEDGYGEGGFCARPDRRCGRERSDARSVCIPIPTFRREQGRKQPLEVPEEGYRLAIARAGPAPPKRYAAARGRAGADGRRPNSDFNLALSKIIVFKLLA